MKNESAVQFETDSRIHMGLAVRNLERSVAFYSTLLGQGPTKTRPRYAKFEVAEGTRPRLPWAVRLPELQADPHLSLPLLEALKDDPEQYVRRSDANHLGDIAKDHPEVAFGVCEEWLEEVLRFGDDGVAEKRRWIVRHAVRHPAKKGNARAIKIREMASKKRKADFHFPVVTTGNTCRRRPAASATP